MSGRLCGAPRSTSLTLKETDRGRPVSHPNHCEESIISVLVGSVVFTDAAFTPTKSIISLTCHGAEISCQHRQWTGPVQPCPGGGNIQRNIGVLQYFQF